MEEREILDMLGKHEDMSELICVVNSIIDMVKVDSNEFILNLQHALIDKCTEEGRCPECGDLLQVVDKYHDCRGEFWGRPVTEVVYVYGCTSCNYIEK